MKQALGKLSTILFSLENRTRNFYVLAFTPFFLMAYFYAQWPFGLATPFYAFLLLVLKKQKLFSQEEATSLQKLLGLIVIITSFFVYFVVVRLYPKAPFYSVANYSVYVIGLFLLFFKLPALKEAFSPSFLMVAASSNSFVSKWVKPFFTPYIPLLVSTVATILKTIGIPATVSGYFHNVILIPTTRSQIPAYFSWECIGFDSMFIFSIILVVIMSEEPSAFKTKMLWATVGLIGTIGLNVIRIILILVAGYFYGTEVGGKVHYIVGYALFSMWVLIFFYLFSKRHIFSNKIRSILQL